MSWKDVQGLVEGSQAYFWASERVDGLADQIEVVAERLKRGSFRLWSLADDMKVRHMRADLGGEEALHAYYDRVGAKAREEAHRLWTELQDLIDKDGDG